jgi:predicted nucleotidyltransferase
MHNLHILPAPLLKELKEVAHNFESSGIQLILFGSFATGNARPTSDLDLAFDSRATSGQEIRQLYSRIDDLHTIRSVDLVDLQKVDPGVAEEIKNNGRILSECLAD